jgi:hypothetical protein
MKALFLHHPYVRPRFEQDFVDRLAELEEFDTARADLDALAVGRLASPDRHVSLGEYEAVVVFVAFNALRRAAPIEWGGYGGLRVLFDHDTIQNYSDIFDPTLRGAWPDVFRRHRFDSMVTSGRAVQALLAADRIAADWVAKGFDPGRFADLDGPRSGITSYGSAYLCRVVAERAIVDAGLPLQRLGTTPYPELGAALARFLACMAVSSDLCVALDQRPSLDLAQARSIPMKPGLEPMAKVFEAAGAGCCPIVDAMDDLSALGFAQGETAIMFGSHDELIEQLRWWFERPEQVRELGRAAARLARARHTWAHRAASLRDALQRRLSGAPHDPGSSMR